MTKTIYNALPREGTGKIMAVYGTRVHGIWRVCAITANDKKGQKENEQQKKCTYAAKND